MKKFRNHVAKFYWVIGMIFIAATVIFIVPILFRPATDPYNYAMAIFFSFGALGILSFLIKNPWIDIEISQTGIVTVTRNWPLRKIRSEIKPGELGTPRVIKTKDIDGDPYFKLVLKINNFEIVIAENSDSKIIDEALDDFVRATKKQ